MRTIGAVDFKTIIWPEISDRIGVSFSFTFQENIKFLKNKTAMLIAAIPYLAGCSQPMRTALSHLAVYELARKECKDIFSHTLDDNSNLLGRLSCIGNFTDGNRLIIRRGMNLLALCMISNYRRDVRLDPIMGKYNPFADGAWDYEDIRNGLLNEIKLVPCGPMDAILSIDEAAYGWWDGH